MGEKNIINFFERKDKKEKVARGTNELVEEIFTLTEGLKSERETLAELGVYSPDLPPKNIESKSIKLPDFSSMVKKMTTEEKVAALKERVDELKKIKKTEIDVSQEDLDKAEKMAEESLKSLEKSLDELSEKQ